MSTVIVNLSNLCLILINSCITNGFVDIIYHACAEKNMCQNSVQFISEARRKSIGINNDKKTGIKSIKSC